MISTIIQNKSVCAAYRKELYDFFAGKGIPMAFREKTIIELGSKPAEYVYLIKKGFVKQYFMDHSGDTKILLLLTRGDLFGEITLFQRDKDRVITQAHSDVEADKLPAELFMHLTETNPRIYFYISLMLSTKARIFMAQVQDCSFCDTAYKLKNLLIRLSYQHGDEAPDGTRIIPRFTHEDLARMISSTRSTVTKKMKVLEEEGCIEIRDRHIIVKEMLKYIDQ